MYLWETVKLSPSVIEYFALSVVVGIRAGACPTRTCAHLLCSFTRVPAAGRGALLETALVVPAGAAPHSSEGRIRLGVLASWGGVRPSAPPPGLSPTPPSHLYSHRGFYYHLGHRIFLSVGILSSLQQSAGTDHPTPLKPGAPQDGLPFGFQKLPVVSIVLHNDTNYFFYYIGFFPCFVFFLYI